MILQHQKHPSTTTSASANRITLHAKASHDDVEDFLDLHNDDNDDDDTLPLLESQPQFFQQQQDFEKLAPGLAPDFYVVKEYKTSPVAQFNLRSLSKRMMLTTNTTTLSDKNNNKDDDGGTCTDTDPCFDRMSLTTTNVTVPIALMLVDPVTYPSLSRARKACRKRSILVVHHDHNNNSNSKSLTRTVGLVGDRVVPGDILQLQLRFGNGGYFPYTKTATKATHLNKNLPVLYEDDHFAIVHKPAGMLVYKVNDPPPGSSTTTTTTSTGSTSSTSAATTVHAVLPHILTPPSRGTLGVLNRPRAVHRLDKPTSGCLVIAKTKPAMVHLARQFHDRLVQKTYVAIVNGRVPKENTNPQEDGVNQRLPWEQARDQYGIEDDEHSSDWYLIDAPLKDNSNVTRHAVTLWRPLQYSASRFANDQTLSLVQLKPKTGRYHQLRRHMAWFSQRPLVGDDDYDGGDENAKKLRGRGLFLCATRITLEHPYHCSHKSSISCSSSSSGTKDNIELEQLFDRYRRQDADSDDNGQGGAVWVSLCRDHENTINSNGSDYDSKHRNGKVIVTAQVPLPTKFTSLLQHEQERFNKFRQQEQHQQQSADVVT